VRVLAEGTMRNAMSSEPVVPKQLVNLELPVDELLRRARPLHPREAMVIEDLDEAEGSAFLAALAT
jgi:hypothetical protein